MKCSPNHILNLAKDRCTNREGCQLFSNSGLCLRCKNNYQLFDGKCL